MTISLLQYDELNDLEVLAADQQGTASSRCCLFFNGGNLTVKNLQPKVHVNTSQAGKGLTQVFGPHTQIHRGRKMPQPPAGSTCVLR